MEPVKRDVVLDRIIEGGMLFLLIFTPLSFGAVQDWSAALMEIVSFIIFGTWLLKQGRNGKPVRPRMAAAIVSVAFLCLVALQLVPLPQGCITVLSPAAGRLYQKMLDTSAGGVHSLSIHPEATWSELWRFLAYSAVFVVIVRHYTRKEQIKKVLYTIVGMGCFLTVFAVIQKLTWNGRLYWLFPIRQGLESNSSYIWGPYINHNHFASYLEMAVPLGMGLLLYRSSSRRERMHASSGKHLAALLVDRRMPEIVWMNLALVVMASGIIMSLSRGGMLGLGSSAVLFAALARSRRSLRKMVGRFILAGGIIMLVIVTSAWGRIGDRFAELDARAGIIRLDIWKDALAIIRDYPLMGSGFGTFGDIHPIYQKKYSLLNFEHAENDYLELATDTGITGLGIALTVAVLFLYSVLSAWWRRRNPFSVSIAAGGLASVAAFLIHGVTDFNLRVPANALLFFVICGIIYTSVFNVRSMDGLQNAVRHRKTRRSAWYP